MLYAFRVYAAIYDHTVVEAETDKNGEAICFVYGGAPFNKNGSRKLYIPARYKMRPRIESRPNLMRYRYREEELYLFCGIDHYSGNPDWLGEIFEWLSSSHEMGIVRRDGVGRVPYSEMIFDRQGISPRKPYALLVMAWLESSLRNGGLGGALPRAASPIPGTEHVLICSHDIDFYYANWGTTFVRLIKNLGISCHPYRSWSYFRSNLRMILGLMWGERVGDYLPRLVEASEESKFSSTLFVVPRRGHRRDPNYQLKHVTLRLCDASQKGFRVGLHGSYTSIIESAALVPEVASLEDAVGERAIGSRQHWLRFDRHQKLFDCVESARLKFDSTLGFADMVGFRNGASFAFPPYDFANERPYEFLEIPLVLMDGSLEAASRSLRQSPQEIADAVLQESRKWGWGGIAALWHNPIEPLAVPEEINRVFWNCVNAQRKFQEKWLSAEEFLSLCLPRYQNAGLLSRVRLDA